jgi:RND family efflux transporter MFP subunit
MTPRSRIKRLGLDGCRAAVLSLAIIGPAAAEEFDCVIEPASVVKVAGANTGLLASVLVDRGDYVKAGQVLAKMESSVDEVNLAQAKLLAANETAVRAAEARLGVLNKKERRIEQLRRGHFVSDSAVDDAATELFVADQLLQEAQLRQQSSALELERAERVLALKTIRSPVDGVVIERHLSPGEYRTEQSAFFTIAEIDPLRVEVRLPKMYFGRVALGDEGRVKPEYPALGDYVGKVAVVDQVIQAATGTFGVRLTLPNPGRDIAAGLRCRVELAVRGTIASRM